MRFLLLDRITHIEPGVSIRAVKALSLAEEYLQDHFPKFPVLPGVLMVEALQQAAFWMVQAGDNFHYTDIALREVRGVKFAEFVQPGQLLRIEAEVVKTEGPLVSIKAQSDVDGRPAVSGRLTLERAVASERYGNTCPSDEYIRGELRRMYATLLRPLPATV